MTAFPDINRVRQACLDLDAAGMAGITTEHLAIAEAFMSGSVVLTPAERRLLDYLGSPPRWCSLTELKLDRRLEHDDHKSVAALVEKGLVTRNQGIGGFTLHITERGDDARKHGA